MLELFVRILARYCLVPLLMWLGMPEEAAAAIAQDKDLQMLLIIGLPSIGAAIEGWTWWARRRGRAT